MYNFGSIYFCGIDNLFALLSAKKADDGCSDKNSCVVTIWPKIQLDESFKKYSGVISDPSSNEIYIKESNEDSSYYDESILDEKERIRTRFTCSDDISLLKEVIAHNPYHESSAWDTVVMRMRELTGKGFSRRNLREHTELLLRAWVRQDIYKLRKNGTEEQYSNKEKLLEELKYLKLYTRTMKKQQREDSVVNGVINESLHSEVLLSGQRMFAGLDDFRTEQSPMISSPSAIHDVSRSSSSLLSAILKKPIAQHLIPHQSQIFRNHKVEKERTRIRFSYGDDIFLLREVVTCNPYIQNGVWHDIANRMKQLTGKPFTKRTLRDHTETLLRAWMKHSNEAGYIRKPGIDGEYSGEKAHLLEQLRQLRADPTAFVAPTYIGHNVEGDSVSLCSETCSSSDSLDNMHMRKAAKLDTSMSVHSSSPVEISPSPADLVGVELVEVNETKDSFTIKSDQPEPEESSSGVDASSLGPTEFNENNSCGRQRVHSSKVKMFRNGNKRKLGKPSVVHKLIRIIQNKNEADSTLTREKLRLREEELELKKRQLKLDEDKFALEKLEREERLKIDIKRLEIYEKQQEVLIKLLSEKIKK